MNRIFQRHIHYDYLICGGGTVGLTLANSITSNPYLSNKRILLVEKNKGINFVNKLSIPETTKRVFLTNPRTIKLFKDINVWHDIEQYGSQHINEIELWDSAFGKLNIKPYNTISRDPLCHMIDNDILMLELCRKLLKNNSTKEKKINVMYQTSVTKVNTYIDNGKPIVEATLSDKSQVTADLLIACDGSTSPVRKMCNIGTCEFDYDVIDHVATIFHSPDVLHTKGYKKFTSNGTIAFLSLRPGVSSLSWCVDNPLGRKLENMTDEEFIIELNKALAEKTEIPFGFSTVRDGMDWMKMALYPGTSASEYFKFSKRPIQVDNLNPQSRMSYPLRLILAKEYLKDNVLLIGDAAHRIHPITGQGLNQGIKDVELLLGALEKIHILGRDNFDHEILLNFSKKRMNETKMHVAFGTAVKYSFSFPNNFATSIASLGLNFCDSLPFKTYIIDKALN